jgi:hypothetical protein
VQSPVVARKMKPFCMWRSLRALKVARVLMAVHMLTATTTT